LNLFGLDRSCVLSSEAELGDGDIVKNDVEVAGAIHQLSSD
jgi:hypothetical protein